MVKTMNLDDLINVGESSTFSGDLIVKLVDLGINGFNKIRKNIFRNNIREV